MNRLIIYFIFFVTLLIGFPAYSADFQKGVNAYYKEDYAVALREWKPLAEQGFVRAQYNLGLLYVKGRGVPQDYIAAVKWYRLAAEQGHAIAQYDLGSLYYDGLGVLYDYKVTLKWWTLAAEQGHVTAQYNIGWMHAEGQGVPKDYTRAHMWFSLAALQGDQNAVKNRNIIENGMTPAQIETAQRLAREWVEKHQK